MSTKQLYEKTSEGMKEVSPLVAIEDIYSKLSDTPLEALVSLYNHVKCEWKGSVADTRRTVPLFLRRSGLFITYNNGTKYVTEFFSAGTNQITTEGWVKDSNWTPVPDEDYISAGVKPGVGSIGYEQLNDNLKQLFREKVNVTNYPDDEDIASVDNTLKLKDREANAANFQSKGYVILRKNLRLINGVVKNILTQNMINKTNTIYEIKYDFDLNNTEITIPKGCILDFRGGNFSNGILHSDRTIVLGNPDSEIIGTIYDKDGIEISSKNKKKKCSAFNVYSSFSMFGDSLKMPNINDKRVFYRDTGMNKIWLCILLQYDDVNNKVFIPDWYYDYHNLGGLSGVVKYLNYNMGCETVCVKLHKNYNFKNTANEPKAYEEFCYKLIDEMKLVNINTIFISNEEYSRIISGSIWLKCFKNIIQYAHSKDIEVGFSMNQWKQSIKNIDLELLNMIDKPYENFYPELNWKDEKSSLSDLPMMINTVYTRLLRSKKILMDRKPNAKYGISECGIARCTKALRYPYEFNADNLGDKDTTGNIFDLFWRAILEGAENAGVYDIANWYLDESESSDIKKETINYIFCKVW